MESELEFLAATLRLELEATRIRLDHEHRRLVVAEVVAGAASVILVAIAGLLWAGAL